MKHQREMASSLVVILFGTAFLIYATRYPIDTWENPGPAVFPLVVGGLLTLLAAGQFIRSFWKWKGRDSQEKDRKHHHSPGAWFQGEGNERTALAMIGLFVLYLLAMQWIGFFISTFCFALFTSRLAGAKEWPRSVGLAAGLTLFCYLLFEMWLKLSFPRGIGF